MLDAECYPPPGTRAEREGTVEGIKVEKTTTHVGKMPVVEHYRWVRLDAGNRVQAVVGVDADWNAHEDLLAHYRRCVPV